MSAAGGGAGGRPEARLLTVALVAAVVGLPALIPGFILDDHRIVEQNELIRDFGRLPEIVSNGYWTVGDTPVPNLYRPLTILSFALNYAVGGLHPFGYRLVNLALHVLVSVLVYLLARRRLGGGGAPALLDPALVAGLLFAVHPVHTEVLGGIVGRAELLAAAGTLGCLLAFLRGRQAAETGGATAAWYTLAIACFVAGFLGKENGVAAPFLALLADLSPAGRRPAWRFHVASAAALAGCLGLRAWAIGGLNPSGFVHYIDNPIAHVDFVTGRLTALKVLAKYALLLVAPVRLSFDYSFDAIRLARSLLDPGALAGGALLVAWFLATAAAWKRAPQAAFALGFTGLALAPVANLLLPIGTIMAERALYLPSVGVCLLVGFIVDFEWNAPVGGGARPAPRAPARAVVAIVLVALALRSEVRLRDWMDDYTLFKSAQAVTPRSVRALFNYGSACEERGEDDEAIRVYRKASAIAPFFADANYNLAGVYARRGAWVDAVERYRAALAEQPGNVRYLVNLAHAQNGQGSPAEARRTLRRALDLDPRSDQAYTTLGAAELALHDPRAAVAAYTEALRLKPGNPDYLRNLALAQGEAGEAAAAVASYRRALEIRPDDPELLSELGLALLKAGDAGGALESLRRAASIAPGQPVVHYRLAQALEKNAQPEEAAAQYRESIRLAPSVPIPLRGLGLLLFRMGDRNGALEALEQAAALDGAGRVMDAESRAILDRLRRARRRSV
ncbi:MAG TPA: tetratricopeptide repeat protein [Candidatus Polarisedimenticolia bacterium]|nr:tetratricopeptide repeat protein [Candidatus Polarisedimenticolia bacterium]